MQKYVKIIKKILFKSPPINNGMSKCDRIWNNFYSFFFFLQRVLAIMMVRVEVTAIFSYRAKDNMSVSIYVHT